MTHTSSPSVPLPSDVTRGRSVILLNDDRANVGGYVVYRPPQTPTGPSASTVRVGRVEEILADAATGVFLGMLVSQCIVGEVQLPYRMPSCRVILGEHTFLPLIVSGMTSVMLSLLTSGVL